MTLPEELEEWLDEEASPDADRGELLAQAIVRLAEASEVDVPDIDTVAALEERVDELSASEPAAIEEAETAISVLESDVDGLGSRVDDLETEVTDLEADVDGKIDDVRDRVIQVLREAEAKADADHDHPELEDSLSDLRTEFEEFESHVEAVVSESAAGIEDLETKVTKVAGAVVRLQRRVGELEAKRAQRDAMADLAKVANRHGVTNAACGNCGKTVHVGLLATPNCPHCESQFETIEPKTGFFGSTTLTVGERPALEGSTETATEPADIFEDSP